MKLLRTILLFLLLFTAADDISPRLGDESKKANRQQAADEIEVVLNLMGQ